jgi:nucleoside 2-deoxyribosyltransferase
MHSVGVGDVYNVTYIYDKFPEDIEKTMKFSAWSSVFYAKTMCYETFKEQLHLLMENADEQTELMGIRVPWFFRRKINIYMAAPDFSYVDTSKLNELVGALKYHNFNPRLPIRENGQITNDMNIHEERVIFSKDIELLEECDFMIATLLYNDQGTLVEIGTYQAQGKTVILYDPYKLLNNMFLKYSCNKYCQNLSEIMNAVFEITGRVVNK